MKNATAFVSSKQIAAVNCSFSHTPLHSVRLEMNEYAKEGNTIIDCMLRCCSIIASFRALEWKQKQSLSLGFGDASFLGWWSACLWFVMLIISCPYALSSVKPLNKLTPRGRVRAPNQPPLWPWWAFASDSLPLWEQKAVGWRTPAVITH